MFPFLPPSLLGPAGATGALHPLLGVPVLGSPANLLAQQYLWALAASAAETPATSAPSSVSTSDQPVNRSASSLSRQNLILRKNSTADAHREAHRDFFDYFAL